jgi:hypothetical protein
MLGNKDLTNIKMKELWLIKQGKEGQDSIFYDKTIAIRDSFKLNINSF